MATTITSAMNGRIPTALLTAVPFQTSLRLAADAAPALGRLREAIKSTYNWGLVLNTAYRTVAEQNALKAAGKTTVSGGRSEHGLGRAVDIDGLGGFSGTKHKQLSALAGEYGWYQPSWAINGLYKNGKRIQQPEPWHWEYDPGRDKHANDATTSTTSAAPTPTVSEEDEMQLFIGIVTNDIAKTDADYGSSFVIDPIAGFVQTSKGLGSRADLDGYRALAGLQGWKIVEKVTDKNALTMSKARYTRSAK